MKWELDRASAIASEAFDIHRDALKFVSAFPLEFVGDVATDY
jgi:hypothetical protein